MQVGKEGGGTQGEGAYEDDSWDITHDKIVEVVIVKWIGKGCVRIKDVNMDGKLKTIFLLKKIQNTHKK